MKSKTSAFVAISILIVFMAWQCFTWPVVQMGDRWVYSEAEVKAASKVSIERPPTPGEIAFRGIACTVSLLLGAALMRAFRSK